MTERGQLEIQPRKLTSSLFKPNHTTSRLAKTTQAYWSLLTTQTINRLTSQNQPIYLRSKSNLPK